MLYLDNCILMNLGILINVFGHVQLIWDCIFFSTSLFLAFCHGIILKYAISIGSIAEFWISIALSKLPSTYQFSTSGTIVSSMRLCSTLFHLTFIVLLKLASKKCWKLDIEWKQKSFALKGNYEMWINITEQTLRNRSKEIEKLGNFLGGRIWGIIDVLLVKQLVSLREYVQVVWV